jgi:hypothetical protein
MPQRMKTRKISRKSMKIKRKTKRNSRKSMRGGVKRKNGDDISDTDYRDRDRDMSYNSDESDSEQPPNIKKKKKESSSISRKRKGKQFTLKKDDEKRGKRGKSVGQWRPSVQEHRDATLRKNIVKLLKDNDGYTDEIEGIELLLFKNPGQRGKTGFVPISFEDDDDQDDIDRWSIQNYEKVLKTRDKGGKWNPHIPSENIEQVYAMNDKDLSGLDLSNLTIREL